MNLKFKRVMNQMNREMEYSQNIRDALIAIREACNMTQQQFADELNISRSIIGMIETIMFLMIQFLV